MPKSALRRAVGALVALSLTGLVLHGGVVKSTFALFNAETTNTSSTFSGGWIGPATNLAATYSGNNVVLGWTNGSPFVNTQTLYGYDAGNTAGATCPAPYSASYSTTVTTIANNTTHAYTDTNRASPINGHYYCYELQGNSSTYTSWQSESILQAQVGMVETGLDVTANHNGSIAANDVIVLTWNQRPNITATTATVCAQPGGTVYIGDTTCSRSGSDTYTIARLTGATSITGSTNSTSFTSSTVSTTTSAPFTTTITLKNGTSRTVNGIGTWTSTPSTSVKSNTGTVTVCTSGSACLPTTTDNF